MERTATSDSATMSRSAGLPASFGKCTSELKAKVPDVVKDDFERMARELGFESSGEFLRDIVMHRLYGLDFMRRMAEERLRKVAGMGPVAAHLEG